MNKQINSMKPRDIGILSSGPGKLAQRRAQNKLSQIEQAPVQEEVQLNQEGLLNLKSRIGQKTKLDDEFHLNLTGFKKLFKNKEDEFARRATQIMKDNKIEQQTLTEDAVQKLIDKEVPLGTIKAMQISKYFETYEGLGAMMQSFHKKSEQMQEEVDFKYFDDIDLKGLVTNFKDENGQNI